MTKQEIKKICDKHLDVLNEFAESKHTSELMKIGAYQQQVAIMRLCDELLHFSENKSRQDS